jgi:hypothetical protein
MVTLRAERGTKLDINFLACGLRKELTSALKVVELTFEFPSMWELLLDHPVFWDIVLAIIVVGYDGD